MARGLRTLWLALVLTLLAGTARVARAQDPSPPAAQDRSTPQKLYETFFRGVNDATKRIDRAKDPEGYRRALLRAIACLDLPDTEGLDEDARLALGTPPALALKEVLDFHGKVDVSELPGVDWDSSVFRLVTTEGPVVAVRHDKQWLFSRDTLSRVEQMSAAFVAKGANKYQLRTLREYVPASLRGRALFLEHWQWLGFVLLILLCVIVDRVVVFFAKGIVARLLRRFALLEGVAKLAAASARPFGFFAMALVIWFVHPLLDFGHGYFTVAAKLVASIGAILLAFRAVDLLSARMLAAAHRTESKLDDQLVPLLRKSMKVLVAVGGALFILDNLEMDITSLLAGVSVAGLAVSFAARDTVANLFGSVTVFLDRPFQVGDWIVMPGVEGVVEEVGFRTTRVRTFYNSRVSVPNSLLVTGVVDNMGERRYRRFKTTVGIQYDTPPERVEAFCQGIREIVKANPLMRQDALEVYLNDFGPSSLDILVYVFFDVPDWDTELRQRQNFMVEILRLARDLHVEFAFPTETLHVAGTPERPAPPPPPVDQEEMWRIVNDFGKGGTRSRPDGSDRWRATPIQHAPPPPRDAD